MQLQHDPHTQARIINATSTDTWLWSQGAAPGQPLTNRWPASQLSGHPVTVIVAANGDLLDYIGPEVTADELNAFQAYALEQGPQACETCPPAMGHNRSEPREVRRGPEDAAVDMVAGDGWILPRADAQRLGLI